MSLSTNTTYRVFFDKLGGTNPATFVGDAGEVFLDPSVPALKLSNGSTPGGVAIGGGSSTGNITFSGERIIGETNGDFPLGVIQLTPSLNDEGGGAYYVDNGQYVNIYPTVADDAPHIHITAGILSTTSAFYNAGVYTKGDLFIGDDTNYLSIRGDGKITINSNPYNGQIGFGTGGALAANRLQFNLNGNLTHVYEEGFDLNDTCGFASPPKNYVGTASTGTIYLSRLYGNQIGSVKLLIQCQGSLGGSQLSELLIVRGYNSTTVYQNEIGIVSDLASNAPHVTFTSSYNVSDNRIEVGADTTGDPDGDQWSFVVFATEIVQYQS